jgi:hypothetical protein
MNTDYSNWFSKCEPIYYAFGPDRLNSLPILDIGHRVGQTDYIDFITADDMPFPIMIGKDCHNRPFLSIKYKVNNIYMVGTFFQRYTDDLESWAYGTLYTRYGIYHDSRVRFDDYKALEQRLRNLLNGIELRELTYFDKNFNIEIGNGPSLVTLAA